MTLGVHFPAVRLEPYSSSWADAYEVERVRILSVVGDRILGIEHVGSTAIPEICAKPIIDIALAVQDLSVAEALVPMMASLGYDFAGDGGVPGHRIFGRGPRVRTHLVHAVVADGQEWRNYIAFRRALLDEHELAMEYDSLKRTLAAKFPNDRSRYTSAKGQFIEKVLRNAG